MLAQSMIDKNAGFLAGPRGTTGKLVIVPPVFKRPGVSVRRHIIAHTSEFFEDERVSGDFGIIRRIEALPVMQVRASLRR